MRDHPTPFLERYDVRTRTLPGAAPDGATPSSLDEAERGDLVEVSNILFEMVRDRCWELGIFRGEVFECRGRRNGRVLLDHPRLGRIALERHYARFVSTEPAPRAVGPERFREPRPRTPGSAPDRPG